MRAAWPILFVLGFALGCLLVFDSMFIDIGVAIVLTLVATLVPVSVIFRQRDRRRQ